MGYSDFLFAMPSFRNGMAASLDMGATLTTYNESRDANEADVRALRADWMAVGKDILVSMEKYGKENK